MHSYPFPHRKNPQQLNFKTNGGKYVESPLIKVLYLERIENIVAKQKKFSLCGIFPCLSWCFQMSPATYV